MQRPRVQFRIALIAFVLSACSPALASPTVAPTPSLIIATQTLIPALAPTLQVPASEAEIPRVTIADAKAAFDNGQAIIVDVRSKQAYDASHIKGALYIGALEDSQSNLTVPKNQWIITYCT